MCEPISTGTAIGLAMTAISTGLGMYAQYEQGRTASRAATAQAEYNAQVAENEKAVHRQLAQNEIAKGAADRERLLRTAARQKGETASMLAASGFEMDSGSSLSLLGESAEEAQYDANLVTENAARAAWQHQAGMTAADNQISLFNSQAANARSGPDWLGMGGTLLGGIASGMNQYNGYRNSQGANASKDTSTSPWWMPKKR